MKPEHIFLEKLFVELNAAAIRYAVMRNYQSLPYSTNGSDLDILVHPSDAEHARTIIFNTIKQAGGVPIGYVDIPGFLKIFALGSYERDNEKILWWGLRLDISFGLYFAGAINLFEWPDEYIEMHNGVSILNATLANILGVLKEVLNNNQLPARYIDAARKDIDKNWTNISMALAPMGGKASYLFRALLTEKIEESTIYDRCASIRKALSRHAFWQSPLAYIYRRVCFEWSKVHRYISPPGLMIAILGVDGSGKSTIIGKIRPILEEATHNALFIKHLRPFLFPPLARLKGKKVVFEKPVLDPHGSNPSGTLGSLLRLIYLLLDYILGYWILIRPQIAKQPAIALFDRYAYDIAIDPRRFRIGISARVACWFTKIAPKPDLIFCLHAAPETIAARKQELPIAEIQRQLVALKAFAANQKNAVLVSTEGCSEDVREDTLKILHNYLYLKF